MFANVLREVEILDDADFAPYGVVGDELESMRERFADWRAELLGD